MKALCSSCGAEYRWHGTRRSRLADTPSPCCDAPGTAYREAARPSIFVQVEQFGGMGTFDTWEWHATYHRVYLLANGHIQLETGVIYRPVDAPPDGDAHFRYAGGSMGFDPFMERCRMRMALTAYKRLRERQQVAA